jgi:hypothetical protein
MGSLKGYLSPLKKHNIILEKSVIKNIIRRETL